MYKMAIAVRDDIKLSKGKTAAQVAHAAVSCTLIARKNSPASLKRWLTEGQKKIVLKVPGLEDIRALEITAREMNIIAKVIVDAGHTEVEPGTVTCIGLGPASEKVLDKITRVLKLM